MAYSAGDMLARAVMHNVTGLPEDDCINDFAWHYNAPLSTADMDAVAQIIDNFYNVADTGALPISSYISEAIDRGATHEITFYRIQSGPLGSPIYSVPWLGPDAPETGNNLPAEVAAVASFHAVLTGVNEEVGSTRPRARRRGRVFLGPLCTNVYDVTQSNPRLKSEFTQVMRFAMAELRDNGQAGGEGWGVWSRQDQLVRLVSGGWTDNAFDSQRRRGVAATTRVNWGNP